MFSYWSMGFPFQSKYYKKNQNSQLSFTIVLQLQMIFATINHIVVNSKLLTTTSCRLWMKYSTDNYVDIQDI
jgi:hypothetical protein